MAQPPAKRQPVFTTIAQLRPDTSGHNLTVKVLSQRLVLQRPSRPNTKPATIAECLVGDPTGCIILTARNEQVEFMEEGHFLTLRNAKIDMYKGSMRLAVNQWGVIERAPEQPDFSVKMDLNLSNVEYELVRIDAAGSEGEQPAAAAAPAEQPSAS
ncbi:g1842 [Coccomyxa viridis]|uniref:G1842 protein n=1 Tax=Coccomyxa viridis TaxID=1274662 RepID=A0ABP1FQV6_9CHLO